LSGDNSFLTDLEGINEKLKQKGANDDLCAFVEDLLVQQHQRYHRFMTAEADKRRLLLDYLSRLEVHIATHSLPPANTPCLQTWASLGTRCIMLSTSHATHTISQNEKRQLETAMVVESRIHNKTKASSRRSLGDAGDAIESEVCHIV
jgi:hypothetical protein